jgi:phosphoribosylformylglycinamidine synthase subunit PurQ / glutaminase
VKDVRTVVITGYGINADGELAEAFTRAGSGAKIVHIRDLIATPELLDSVHILAFPGGFSFGDHLGSGLVFAHLCRQRLYTPIRGFIERGNLVIGICNGFQVLVKMGILPNLGGKWEPEATIIYNDSGVFIDAWVTLEANPDSPCIWTRGLGKVDFPIRHGEGRFWMKNEDLLEKLETRQLAALRYWKNNPNGSVNSIAGITDPSGRILGLMPHPEAFLVKQNHPGWTRQKVPEECGMEIFNRGVQYVRENIL